MSVNAFLWIALAFGAGAQPIAVHAVAARFVDGEGDAMHVSGTLEAHRELQLAFVVGGVIEQILIDDGATVARGWRVAGAAIDGTQ